MFASRSALPVSTVSASSIGPLTAMQACPARIAIAIAGRTGGAGLAQAPGGGEPLAHATRDQPGIGFGRGAQALHLRLADAEQVLARRAGVDDAAADEVGGGAGNGEERGADQPAGGGLGDRERMTPAC